MNIVFILGAGASADARVPLMNDFLGRAMEISPQGEEAEAFALVKKARAQLTRAHSKAQLNIRNVESVFAAFEMSELFGRLGNLTPDEISQLTPAMRRMIVYTIEHYMEVRVSSGRILAPTPYVEFGSLIKALRQDQHTVSVVTFNYDLGVDMGFGLNDVDVDYCLVESKDTSGRAVELLKLHGSLNWAVCPKCRRILPKRVALTVNELENKWELEGTAPKNTFLAIPMRLVRMSGVTFKATSCGACNVDRNPDPMIVPPTASKACLHRELSSVWKRAAHWLSRADNVFVIGLLVA